MKLFVIFLVIISTVTVFADTDDDWVAFKIKFGKLFLSKDKEAKRKAAFKKNKAELDALQTKFELGHIAYQPEIYPFHDLEPEERLARMTGAIEIPHTDGEIFEATPESRQVNALATNYSSVSLLNPVKDQLQCGSCWAFSAVNAIEGAYKKKTNVLVNLAEQYLVDCGDRYSNGSIKDGCQGGWPPSVISWLAANGGAVETSQYAYTGVFGKCDMTKTKKVTNISKYITIANDTTSIKNAIMTYGSLSIAVDANQWFNYGKGVFTATSVGPINHAVNLVGWGYDPTAKQYYWLVRNSWSKYWGENGYIRLSQTPLSSYYVQYTFAVVLV